MTKDPVKQFQQLSLHCSKSVTATYSTSFFSAIKLLHPTLHDPVFSIYGFVRLADEIVDSFHDYNKEQLLSVFKRDTYAAIDEGISLNPILNSFQQAVNTFNIDLQLVDAFFKSMEADLAKNVYRNSEELDEYIYGSAEVVGLMCLYVFCEGDEKIFNELKESARSLGAAFQKVNFLRDIKADYQGLNRTYFPNLDFCKFTQSDKLQIESDIEKDFEHAYKGILALPSKARFGVYVAYKYYRSLFNRIKRMKPQHILEQRIRIPNLNKATLLLSARIANHFNLIYR